DGGDTRIGVAAGSQALLFDNTGGDWGYYYTGYSLSDAIYNDLPDDKKNDIDVVMVASAQLAVQTTLVRHTFSTLANSLWGSAVEIVGNTVYVGAKGKSRTAVYDLSQSDYSHWTATVGGVTDTPLRTTFYTDASGGLGTEIAAVNSTDFLVSRPANGSGSVEEYQQTNGVWSNDTSIKA